METNNYTSLMERRVRRILLVCNNYDSFALEEDGHIDVQIAQEYAELNLSNPPAIVRAETTREALSAKIAETDKEINARVYALYGLTEQEIAIVEQ